eukprot:11199822-Alexandrium_andersonii.AAC.1
MASHSARSAPRSWAARAKASNKPAFRPPPASGPGRPRARATLIRTSLRDAASRPAGGSSPASECPARRERKKASNPGAARRCS